MNVLDRFRIDGKTALVTGCRRGIGKAMAIALAEAGADIIGVSHSLEATGSEIEKEVTARGRTFRAYACDLVCLEPGQELAAAGRCVYYVIAGKGEVKAGQVRKALSLGSFARFDDSESHTIVNSSEQRLICLAVC